jgi:hypothetical protein
MQVTKYFRNEITLNFTGGIFVSAVLTHGHVCCVRMVFLMFKTDFVGSTNTINICLILSTYTVYSYEWLCRYWAPMHCCAREAMKLSRRSWHSSKFQCYNYYVIQVANSVHPSLSLFSFSGI